MLRDIIDERSFLFKRLILMFHTAAMQNMGKLTDSITGEMKRDLQQASLAINTLDMLWEKCNKNLSEDESNFFQHILSELKLNYVDEVGRPDPQPASKDEKSEEQETVKTGEE